MTARWTPIRVSGRTVDAPAFVDWCRTDGVAFDDPFLDQTIERALRHPARLLFRRSTAVADLLDEPTGGSLPLAGIILHLSRCGSTLLTRMLGDVPGVLAVSEPATVDSVLRLPAASLDIDEVRRTDLIRAVVAGLAQPDDGEQRCVLKLDAWAALQLPVLRAAFPAVPWVFVSRAPAEVLVSHRGHRGYHLIPGTLPPSLLGIGSDAAPIDLDEYGALVLGRIAAAADAAGDDPLALFVDHAHLPEAAGRVATHFGLDPDPGTRQRWTDRVRQDAKNPALAHQDDRPAKQAAIDPPLRAAVDRWAAAPVQAVQRRAGLVVA